MNALKICILNWKNYFVILWVFVFFSRARVQFWNYLDLKQNIFLCGLMPNGYQMDTFTRVASQDKSLKFYF